MRRDPGGLINPKAHSLTGLKAFLQRRGFDAVYSPPDTKSSAAHSVVLRVNAWAINFPDLSDACIGCFPRWLRH